MIEPKRGMLVLSRKLNERIMIGKDIVIEIVEINRSRVRVGVKAPREIGVFREELLPPLDCNALPIT